MIERFGAPKNYDSQCPEHNHKYVAKKPGRRSRKTNNASEFETQVARRVCEARIIDEIHETINPTITVIDEQNNSDDNVIDELIHYASKTKVIRTGVACPMEATMAIDVYYQLFIEQIFSHLR